MAFEYASSITLSGGQFSTQFQHVHGNLGNLVRPVQAAGGELMIWDNYRCVQASDICLTHHIADTEVRRDKDENWSGLVARRIISVATIPSITGDQRFLYIQYSGEDAYKACKLDFDQFSVAKSPLFARLFGYSKGWNSLPALIFFNALIPLSRILLREGRIHDPLLYTYFEYLVGTSGINAKDMGDLWVNPQTGGLCIGPYIATKHLWIMSGFGLNSMNTTNTPLSIQTYSDSSAVSGYLASVLPPHCILDGINRSRTCSSMGLLADSDRDATAMPPPLPGIYHKHHHKIIAKCMTGEQKWRSQLYQVDGIPQTIEESQETLDNGLVWFTITATDMQVLQQVQRMCFHYNLGDSSDLGMAWLAQACYVFGQLGISEDEWGEYAMDGSKLVLTFEHKEAQVWLPEPSVNIAPDVFPLYFFICAVPCFLDEEAVWLAWMESRKYFWSFDCFGQHEIPSLASLGLPLVSFFSSVEVSSCEAWELSHYKAAQMLHHHYGFDPRTMYFAQQLQLPLLEVVTDTGRFEEASIAISTQSSHCNKQLALKGLVVQCLDFLFRIPAIIGQCFACCNSLEEQ